MSSTSTWTASCAGISPCPCSAVAGTSATGRENRRDLEPGLYGPAWNDCHPHADLAHTPHNASAISNSVSRYNLLLRSIPTPGNALTERGVRVVNLLMDHGIAVAHTHSASLAQAWEIGRQRCLSVM